MKSLLKDANTYDSVRILIGTTKVTAEIARKKSLKKNLNVHNKMKAFFKCQIVLQPFWIAHYALNFRINVTSLMN